MIRLAILTSTVDAVTQHLAASAPQEEGCFCLLREGTGRRGRRLIASELVLPPHDGWELQETDNLRPSARWLSALVSHALRESCGLLFIHSHPDPRFPAGFSAPDMTAIAALGKTIAPMLDGPFAAAVVHPSGWVANVMQDDAVRSVDRVISIGRTLRVLDPPDVRLTRIGKQDDLDDRQRDALGAVHDTLRELVIAVVGAGGLGSPIAEQLVRMGCDITIVDHDWLDTPSNVRRVVGSTITDLRATTPLTKVDVVGAHLDHLGFDVEVHRIHGDVRREGVFRQLLDADVVLAGTDTHGSRATINDLASTYLLPVIDVGVRAGAKDKGTLAALTAEVRVLTPTTPCLWCRRVISAEVIRAENLPPDQHERLAQDGYLVGGFGEPAPSVIALTFLGASLATCALLALLGSEGEVAPSGYIVDGLLAYAQETQPTVPVEDCLCRRQLAMGDACAPPLLPAAAEVEAL